MISAGKCGSDLDEEHRGSCTGCSQIFIAIDPNMFGDPDELQKMLDRRVAAADAAHPINPARPVKCPGENTIERRKKSLEDGVVVDENVWAQIQSLAAGDLNVSDIASK